MKKAFLLSGILAIASSSYASELKVKITSLTNIRGNGAMEACGVVENQSGKTVLVNVKHDESSYTTLTDEEGKWCQVIKRWTYNGETDAVAREI